MEPNMAQLFKSNFVDDGGYPMPPDPNQTAAPVQAGPQVNAADIQRAAGELHQIVSAIAQLRPSVDGMAEALHSSAQQQGYAEGIQRAQAEVQENIFGAMAALTDAQHQRHAIALQHESALAELALQIARKVIGEHLDADPAIVSRIVRESIAKLAPTTSIVVHVNPEDLLFIEDDRAELERLVQGTGEVQIVSDEEVGRGGCLIVSPVGDVDARIETRLAVLEAAFAAQRRSLADAASKKPQQ
jgi:flagellar assembly protein FliH